MCPSDMTPHHETALMLLRAAIRPTARDAEFYLNTEEYAYLPLVTPREILAMAAAVDAERGAREKAIREALEACQAQFLSYAEQHRAKGTPEGHEKAATNMRFANLCRATLTGATP